MPACLGWDSSVVLRAQVLVLPRREGGLLGPEEEGRLLLGPPLPLISALCAPGLTNGRNALVILLPHS